MKPLGKEIKFQSESLDELLDEMGRRRGSNYTIDGQPVTILAGTVYSIKNYMAKPIDEENVAKLLAVLPEKNELRACVKKCCGNELVARLSGGDTEDAEDSEGDGS